VEIEVVADTSSGVGVVVVRTMQYRKTKTNKKQQIVDYI